MLIVAHVASVVVDNVVAIMVLVLKQNNMINYNVFLYNKMPFVKLICYLIDLLLQLHHLNHEYWSKTSFMYLPDSVWCTLLE